MKRLSKRILPRKLQNPRICCALNHAKRRRTNAVGWVVEVGVIQQVEELEAQFEALAFADLENSRHVRVHDEKSRPDQRIISGVSKRASSVGNKCSGANPDTSACVSDVRTSNCVRPVLSDARKRIVRAAYRTEREARMRAK